MLQYSFPGRGYLVKIGSGFGYDIAHFSQVLPTQGPGTFSSTGIGTKIEVEGNTSFGDNLYGYIVLDGRNNFMSEFKDSDGHRLPIPGVAKNASMSFFSLGLKFGFIYYF